MARLSVLSRSIAGKVAVVTGAASGMGRATAHLFADEGAHVAVLDRDADGAVEVAAEITDAGGRAAGWVVDVTEPEMVAGVIGAVRDDLGPIDVLVNNAGVSLPAGIDGEDFGAAWDRTLAVNLTGHTTMIRACLSDLSRDGAGRIVNIASTEGLGATPLPERLHGEQARRHRPHESAGRRAGPPGGDGELRLPRPDPHGHDRSHPRRAQGPLRPATGADRSVRQPRGGCPRDVVAGAAGCLVRERCGPRRGRWPDGPEHLIRLTHLTTSDVHGGP